MQTPADALREQELAELESLRAKLLGVLIAAHPLVQAGVVAHDIVRDGQGNVVIDPRTNEPLRIPLHNSKPVLEAIRLLLAVTESRRAPLGSDAPKRLSLMDAAGIRCRWLPAWIRSASKLPWLPGGRGCGRRLLK